MNQEKRERNKNKAFSQRASPNTQHIAKRSFDCEEINFKLTKSNKFELLESFFLMFLNYVLTDQNNGK